MSRNFLISYASSNPRDYRKSQRKLIKSAKRYNTFDRIFSFTNKDIKKAFKIKNKKILSNKRGDGYWLWKPYLLKKTIDKMNFGDKVLYCDSGAYFINNPEYLLDLCSIDNPIIIFTTQCHKVIEWTKRDCLIIMDSDKQSIHDHDQACGGYQVYCKTPESVKFIDEYLNSCENETLITDTPSILAREYTEFKEHRHDQSILTLLAINYSIQFHRDPSQFGNSFISEYPNDRYPQIFNTHRESNLSFRFRLNRKINLLLNRLR